MQLLSSYHYIPVRNVQRACEWYTAHLGFLVVKKDELFTELRTESGVRVLLLPSDGTITSNMRFPSGLQAAHGFIVSDIESVYQQLIAKGIEVGKLFNYEGMSFSFYDPDGNKIELWSDYPKSNASSAKEQGP